MIHNIQISEKDRTTLSSLNVDFEKIKDDFYDYSKVVVKKPWGYEYLIFSNDMIAVWVLYLKMGAQTSMHCHPNKKTSLVVLEGKVTCSTLNEEIERRAAEGLLIDKGVFHQTTALSERGAFVMEIETPVNKRDLVRLKDRYGREGKGYETEDQHSLNTQNYNYVSFNNLDISHNLKKRFGQCSLTFKELTDKKSLHELSNLNAEDVICLLRGQLLDATHRPALQVGDTLTKQSLDGLEIGHDVEVLVIKKVDHVLKISDYVASFLSHQNLKPVFVVPGEANVHLMDSIGRHEGLSYVCTLMEKSASQAVEAFSKFRSDLGVLVISSGASTVNALPGIASAWIDSVPLLILSGQARTDQDTDGHVRQLGNKSLNIVDLVKPITKYAVKVTEPTTIRYHLEKAVALAKEGRPGPVWIDLPIDLQGMTVDEEDLKDFPHCDTHSVRLERRTLKGQIHDVLNLLKGSSRPVLLAGSGIRNARAEGDLIKLVDFLKIPVLTSRRGADLIPDDHPTFFGRPGTYGQRSANFVIQNCDLLISLGSRLSIPLIGRNTRAFARAAKKVVIDIDPAELKKPTINPNLAIAADAGKFIREWLSILPTSLPDYSNWIKQCLEWKRNFPPDSYSGPSLPFGDTEDSELIYPLALLSTLSKQLDDNSVLVVDGGPPLIYTLLAFRFKMGQRLISATGLELPGFALAGAIGVSLGRGQKPVICLCEERGFQISIQEMQTIGDYRLPVKVIVLKSKGHSIIRNIQKDYFGSRFIGTDNEIRLGTAPLANIVKAYGFPIFEISRRDQLVTTLNQFLKAPGPAICEVHVENDQEMIPRPGFTIKEDQKWVAKPLEDMYPLLDRETLKQNMIIDLIQED